MSKLDEQEASFETPYSVSELFRRVRELPHQMISLAPDPDDGWRYTIVAYRAEELDETLGKLTTDGSPKLEVI